MDDDTPLMAVAGEVYRWKEIAKLSLRLSDTMGDLLMAIDHFYGQNRIPLPKGIDPIMTEAEKLLARIKMVNNLPISEVLRLAPTQLRPPDAGQPKKYPADGTESLAMFPSLLRSGSSSQRA